MANTSYLTTVFIAVIVIGFGFSFGLYKWTSDYTWVITFKKTDGTTTQIVLQSSNLSVNGMTKYETLLKHHGEISKWTNRNKIIQAAPSNEVKSKMASDAFMKRYSDRSEQYTRYITNMCNKYRNEIPKMKKYPNILVNEKHKIVYCQTPKVATVSWCKLFLVLSGYKNYSDVLEMSAPKVSATWKKHVSLLKQFTVNEQEEIMRNYTKVMFVRNPFTRLLSAYNDKLVAKNTSDFKHGLQKVLNHAIIKRVRPGNVTGKHDLTFGEFVKMLVSKHYYRNIHWERMYSICHPCDINYDVIGRMEDIENDSNYILKLVGTNLEFPKSTGTHFTNSSSHERVVQSYAAISDSELEALYQRYLYDFLLFGYEKGLPKG
ncbi:carbohydrate sulfotransferase 11-like [Antedon mediterranea]|uniref:carbohydrate sulfotransferase 11-like n=1 Tax=Antedon mediterranea TaxID=105859 RepID=UPI003AF78203